MHKNDVLILFGHAYSTQYMSKNVEINNCFWMLSNLLGACEQWP